MSKWRHSNDDHDKFVKRSKVKKNKNRIKKSDQVEGFEGPESEWDLTAEKGLFIGRIVEVQKRFAFVSPEPQKGSIDTNTIYLGTIVRKYLTSARAERNFVVVGDRVLCQLSEHQSKMGTSEFPGCVILKLGNRSTVISRKDPLSLERSHVLASNIDQLLIVSSFKSPKIKWGLIDRYLVLAEEQKIPAIIVLNKKDLLKAEDKLTKEYQIEKNYYEKLGYTVLAISLLEQNRFFKEIEILKNIMKDKISLLSGHSGVGKSSLVNILSPEIVQEVEANSEIFYKGRHTTTYASFIKLAIGGAVVDTPGIRSFVLGERNANELGFGFKDIRQYMGDCKFRLCQHINEPECAVLQAREKGHLSERRYRSYKGMLLGITGREGRLRDES